LPSLPGTLQWVLELPEFRDWRLSNENTKSVLWFSGLPGVGKTIISAYIVNILRTQYPGALVLYFFVKAGETGISTISNIICTLAGQLAENEPEAQRHMDRLRSKGLSPTGGLLPAQLIKELLHAVLPTIILSCIRLHAYELHSLGIPTKKFSRRFYFFRIVRTIYGFRYKFVFKFRLSFFSYFYECTDFLIKSFFYL
jgi:hypothetical protein